MESSFAIREASAGSPARPCAVRSEGNIGSGNSICSRGSASSRALIDEAVGPYDSFRPADDLTFAGRAFSGRAPWPRACPPCACCEFWSRACCGARFTGVAVASATAGAPAFVNDCEGNPGAAGPPFRRLPRPPRRPRRRFFFIASVSAPPAPAPVAVVDASSESSASSSAISPRASRISGASESFPASASPARTNFSASPPPECAELSVFAARASNSGSALGFAPGSGSGAPRRVSASSAFFFQSARRKRSTAIVYHFTASSVRSAFSSTAPSSQATMASRVRWYSSCNFVGASGLLFALRIRA